MITIDNKSSKPLYEQIVDNIKELIIIGGLKEGDIIPSVRKLALMINVNPNTISKAYKELERQKIIETVQGRGTFVAKQKKGKINTDKANMIKEKLKYLIIELKCLNFNDKQILSIINGILSSLENINN